MFKVFESTKNMHLKKYNWKILYLLDLFCYILSYPWIAMLSLFLACFWSTTEEIKRPFKKIIHYIIYAPVLALFELFIFPFAAFGYIFWMLICNGKTLNAWSRTTIDYFYQIICNHAWQIPFEEKQFPEHNFLRDLKLPPFSPLLAT